MKLSEYKQTYYEFSGKSSDVARKLAFAGIALIWIFRVEADGGLVIPRGLFFPAILLALTLGFDLLQYISATAVWGMFQWKEEGKLKDPKEDPDLDSPSWLKWPQFVFFLLKLGTILLAYFFLIKHVWAAWFAK